MYTPTRYRKYKMSSRNFFGPIYDIINDIIMAEIAQNCRKLVSLAHLHGSESSNNNFRASCILLLDTEIIKCHLGPFWTDI